MQNIPKISLGSRGIVTTVTQAASAMVKRDDDETFSDEKRPSAWGTAGKGLLT